ncbi:putative Lipopolysaccharide-induced tumor necrosis factor-alpha factor [Gigaspora margarita]|uniref:Putative Lipopolysaccharide-induced tumor necrosis factor-alpha factor n=1 Tax=Gigaspora margarita TaxID=4874 RepID=A0A8H3XE72_GIGMA|nr:putative Lipopolysaccharide-induced tumor necrosis factor-alpha factor [Gigaspora margarita]
MGYTQNSLTQNEDSSQMQNQINNSYPINMGHSSIPSDPPPPFPGSSPPQQPFPGSGPPQYQPPQQQGFSNQPSQQQAFNQSSTPQFQVFPNQMPQVQQQPTQQVNQDTFLQKQQYAQGQQPIQQVNHDQFSQKQQFPQGQQQYLPQDQFSQKQQFAQGQQQFIQQVNHDQTQPPQPTFQQANMGFQQQMSGVPNQQQTGALPQVQIINQQQSSPLPQVQVVNQQTNAVPQVHVNVVQDPPAVRSMNPTQGYIHITSHTPTTVTCPHCNKSVVTVVTEEVGSTGMMIAIVLCLVFFPLAVIPFITPSFKDKTHACPNCRYVLGVVKA